MSDATRFEDFARISADWFWETDIEDRFSYFSVPVTRTGIVLEDKLGSRRRDGAAPEPDNLERLAALEAAIERREPFRDFVFRVGNQAGQMRWCSISGEPRHDRAGAFLGYRGAGRDLTEQLEAQREVELQGLALQAILQAMPDGVQLVDKSDGLLAVNDQIYEILDIPNRASQRDAGSTFQSTLDLARRGEYGPGDPETLARQRSVGAARDDRQPTRAHVRAPAHDRPLGRVPAPRARRWRSSVALPRHHRRQGRAKPSWSVSRRYCRPSPPTWTAASWSSTRTIGWSPGTLVSPS